MKSTQNKMDNSSCGLDKNGRVRNSTDNSEFGSVRNQGDLKEFRNQGDVRDVTDRNGYNDRINMTNS